MRRSDGWLYLFLMSILGCEESTTPPRPEPPDTTTCYVPIEGSYPIHHETAVWSLQGLIAFEDHGIVWVDSQTAAFDIDQSLSGIWVIDPLSRDRHRLVALGSMPSWSPDGTALAFSTGQIFTTSVGGNNVRQLTFEGANWYPSWSPQGDRIVFDRVTSIWTMRPDGSDQRELGMGRMPSWSHDGSRIVYVRFPPPRGNGQVFVMTASGQGVERLTNSTSDDRDPVFSPDDRFISYTRQFPHDDDLTNRIPQIWIMRSDGTAARRLTANGGSHPSWSPDGRRIVFTRTSVCNTPADGVLWIIDVDTGLEMQLTTKWPERVP